METPATLRVRITAAAVLAAAVFLPVFFLGGIIAAREISRYYALTWALFVSAIAFAVTYTGRLSFYRRIFFGISSAAFLLHFKSALFGIEPSCFTAAPFCHISMAPYFTGYLYQQYLALMSGDWRLWGPLTLGGGWLFLTLAIGRGWCSWACFYGGIDDSLSAAPRRSFLSTDFLARKLRDLPAALLIFLLLASLAYMLPVYCLWLCPFKLTDVFLDPAVAQRRLQYGLMAFMLAALVIAPLLTKKRIFCSFLCPFAAWQSFWGRISPFRVAVLGEKCSGCMNCSRACPMNAVRCSPGGKPEFLSYCNLCGQCLDACSRKGIGFTIFGAPLPVAGRIMTIFFSAEKVFVFSALTLAGVFSSLWGPAALNDVVQWLR